MPRRRRTARTGSDQLPVSPRSDATLEVDGDNFTVTCSHGTRTIVRTNDPTIQESDEWMTRYALQRHVDRCDKGCTVPLWMAWYETRRLRFAADGNTRAHG